MSDNLSDERERLKRRVRTVLRASRLDSDLSQRELAAKLGWTRNQVANVESGRRVANMDDFFLIAKAIRVDPEALLRRVLQWR